MLTAEQPGSHRVAPFSAYLISICFYEAARAKDHTSLRQMCGLARLEGMIGGELHFRSLAKKGV
jgi:hypothetical protein